MLSKIYTAALVGVDAKIVEVEIDIQKGLHKFNIVGLPDKAVQESKERVTAAIKNSIADFIPRKITVNLAPADLPKTGPAYDLPIAVGILLASKQINFNTSDYLFIGELSLEGKIRETKGILSIANCAKDIFQNIFIPYHNAKEASLVKNLKVFPVKTLDQLIEHFQSKKIIINTKYEIEKNHINNNHKYDLKDVKGQPYAKRALEIAAAGSHNILLSGTPGSGKTLLAKSIPSILPEMNLEEKLEVTRIHSIAGTLDKTSPLKFERPFRNPHHTCSDVALVGGGTYPKPGEISLAHRGVLFLDEFPEFSRTAIESLRQPLEDKVVNISRATGRISFPANFSLIAAMNPCKCGWKGDPEKECTCTLREYKSYFKKISGPILDRIDLQINVHKIKFKNLISDESSESSSKIQKRVQNARNIQLDRYKNIDILCNTEMRQYEIEKFVNLDIKSKAILERAVDKLNLSARSYFRILRVARTIADLEMKNSINHNHIGEAIGYRINLEESY